MRISVNGFDPENLERIYLGEPALADQMKQLPAECLTEKEYEVAGLAAEDLKYDEISTLIDRSIGTIRTHLRAAYKKLGINSRIGLAGFFPLEPDDPLLENKCLGQLGSRELEATENLSRGMMYAEIGLKMGIAESTARTHIHHAHKKWPDVGRATMITRVANGIRAAYVRELAEDGVGITDMMGDFALHKLVEVEPAIQAAIAKRQQT